MDMEVGSEMERGAGKDVGKPFTSFIVNKIQSELEHGESISWLLATNNWDTMTRVSIT